MIIAAMRDKVREYDAERITISYEAKRCIHARECVRGLPGVFDVNRRVWVDGTQASPDEIAMVVGRCPTGALHFRRKDGGASEPVTERNEARIAVDGPLYLHGNLEIHTATAVIHETRAALCRCGASRNKPFCDNSHLGTAFRDTGEAIVANPGPPSASGVLRVLPQVNGPCLIEGGFTVFNGHGRTVGDCGPRTSFCRCGHSRDKPFCDGSHATVGFTAA